MLSQCVTEYTFDSFFSVCSNSLEMQSSLAASLGAQIALLAPGICWKVEIGNANLATLVFFFNVCNLTHIHRFLQC